MPIIGVKFFEKLKHIVGGHISAFNINYSPTINNITTIQLGPSDDYIKQINPTTLSLDYDRILKEIPPDKRDTVRKAIQEAVTIDDIPLLGDMPKARLEDIDIVENDRDIKSLLGFFKDKIPPEDFAALKSAIYIKNRFDTNAPRDEIYSLKNDLRAKFGLRGIKISKLWSEGYFKGWIKPLYTLLSHDPDFTKEDFLKSYNLIIEEEAFAVFVPHEMTPEQLELIVHRKISSNTRYGIYFITIHGIGKETVETIKEIIPRIERDYEIVNITSSEKYYIIKIKFWFKKP